ncbi:MAG: hypothetical protein KZQ60_16350 [Candidatus Thiodiazotropha sp. (ex Lucinoma aequizonata)]|nr:hypothetical protein [Candidatus Thiodiazotropha sp. (ex Lucinoma aequizonata)]MCU7887049.1 hypothetical protein [Candidatus Thiodiazotropha sp. (ex Lucinoma aequizonata)]MCU7894971.1 hypothetical protein [Candidatus Thiodiazotropha sp. (ex Lucinoma aequizonata)]MCU7907891.1 hypothetical protein [Candidatus Thiodiazotropha sp. (ex Lucinoma aequizonata)]MCU7912101.1 hypothetical protein [Candidatus Thiodiazotropha sp. (ex Lucinoma aequizonata)]
MGDHHEQEPPPFRLISCWNQALRSDSFHNWTRLMLGIESRLEYTAGLEQWFIKIAPQAQTG